MTGKIEHYYLQATLEPLRFENDLQQTEESVTVKYLSVFIYRLTTLCCHCDFTAVGSDAE